MSGPGFVKRHAKAFVVGVVIAALAAGGTAFALWLASGAGQAATKTGTLSALVILDPGADPSGVGLLPGGPARSAVLQVTNNNPAAVELRTVTMTGASMLNGTGACTDVASHVTFSAAGANLPVTVPQGATNVNIPLPAAVTIDATSPNCMQSGVLLIAVATTTTVGA